MSDVVRGREAVAFLSCHDDPSRAENRSCYDSLHDISMERMIASFVLTVEVWNDRKSLKPDIRKKAFLSEDVHILKQVYKNGAVVEKSKFLEWEVVRCCLGCQRDSHRQRVT